MQAVPADGQPGRPAWAKGKGTAKSVMVSSITALIAGVASIFIFPYIAGAIGIVSGAQAIKGQAER